MACQRAQNYTRLDDPFDVITQTQGRPVSPADECGGWSTRTTATCPPATVAAAHPRTAPHRRLPGGSEINRRLHRGQVLPHRRRGAAGPVGQRLRGRGSPRGLRQRGRRRCPHGSRGPAGAPAVAQCAVVAMPEPSVGGALRLRRAGGRRAAQPPRATRLPGPGRRGAVQVPGPPGAGHRAPHHADGQARPHGTSTRDRY